jgi:hypothetical protein
MDHHHLLNGLFDVEDGYNFSEDTLFNLRQAQEVRHKEVEKLS